MNRSSTGSTGGRPMIMGRRHVVSSGHYLATQIGMDILGRGGNAFDAAAAVGFALTVLKPQQNGLGGEAPMLVYSADQNKVHAVSGHGPAPREATLQKMLSYGIDRIPGDGLLGATVTPIPASWIALLERYGTLRLEDVLAGAIDAAENGFVMYDDLRNFIAQHADRFRREWPTSAAQWLPGGAAPAVGTIFRQKDLAATLRRLAEASAKCKGRIDGLHAAHDEFYRGPIARAMVDFCRGQSFRDASGHSHSGLLSLEDFATYQATFEDAPHVDYRGLTVFKCPTWTQGPVMLQSLRLLEGYDLKAMGHNSAPYIHTVTECMKLAFADREFFYGDGEFVPVPMERLLSSEYAADRRLLVDPQRASMELRPGGLPAITARCVTDVDAAFARSAGRHGDTTKLEVIDSRGNMVSATTSGGWLMSSPIVDGLGFALGTRGQMFSLEAGHPNCVAPLKRPRTTLTPSLALRAGRPAMVFGSPGGDAQDQWALQFLLNVAEFDMPLQHAVEAATFTSFHFPSSFYPRMAEPGLLVVEGRIGADVRAALADRGHVIKAAGDFSGGNTLAASIDTSTGVLCAAASPRLEPAYAAGR